MIFLIYDDILKKQTMEVLPAKKDRVDNTFYLLNNEIRFWNGRKLLCEHKKRVCEICRPEQYKRFQNKNDNIIKKMQIELRTTTTMEPRKCRQASRMEKKMQTGFENEERKCRHSSRTITTMEKKMQTGRKKINDNGERKCRQDSTIYTTI